MSLEVTIAAPFRHLHKDQLQRSEFVYYLAIDRMWMSRDQAGILIDRAVEQGLVELRGGLLVPLFPIGDVTVPLGYRPGDEDLAAPDPERELLGRIASATGREEREVAAEANLLIAGGFDGQLRFQAALVLIASRHGVPFQDLLSPLREGMLSE
ncbi:MAG: DUF2240 family protein [Methanospirillum sp.]|nr:DUF2240 family protein [Methanospirillum sp.]